LERVPQSFKVAIENAVLKWNEEYAVDHVKRGAMSANTADIQLDEFYY